MQKGSYVLHMSIILWASQSASEPGFNNIQIFVWKHDEHANCEAVSTFCGLCECSRHMRLFPSNSSQTH